MAKYKIAVYDKSDVSVEYSGNGGYTITIAEGAEPSVITVRDTDAGKAKKEFNDGNAEKDGGYGYAAPENQKFSGEIGGTNFKNATINPENEFSLSNGETAYDLYQGNGTGKLGYAFSFKPEPGVSYEYTRGDVDTTPNIKANILYSGDKETGSGPSGGSGPSRPHPPCFTRGTFIKTARGEELIENLMVGDRIWTEAHGYQPLRWICQRRVAAKGAFAPIRICAGTLGASHDLLVSPEHRMLIEGVDIEHMFGVSKALVAAKDLVNDTSIIVEKALAEVEYFHLLFDQHEILSAHGTLSESFYPHENALGDFPNRQRDELFALFPELAGSNGPYLIAHPGLLAHEAALLAFRG